VSLPGHSGILRKLCYVTVPAGDTQGVVEYICSEDVGSEGREEKGLGREGLTTVLRFEEENGEEGLYFTDLYDSSALS
jgi:hypothetical protein